MDGLNLAIRMTGRPRGSASLLCTMLQRCARSMEGGGAFICPETARRERCLLATTFISFSGPAGHAHASKCGVHGVSRVSLGFGPILRLQATPAWLRFDCAPIPRRPPAMTSPSGAEDGHGPPQHPQQPLQPTALHRTGSSRRMASRLEVELPANALATGAIHLIQKPITSPRTAALSQEERLAMAERRRQVCECAWPAPARRHATFREGSHPTAIRCLLVPCAACGFPGRSFACG